ncbi:MAG TPA: SAM-dependent methyltransferase [Deltaproteobacteria bacterium]|nr:SAM-dependent methyltransferase [Deltaproteobacteria bacterium]HCY11721.1 SAM-dependent methyltransferase [Deltaproteobacteria bacterium]
MERAIDESAARGCPGCGNEAVDEFYTFKDAPVHTVLLLPTTESAMDYPKGDIRLGFCGRCGFIWNRSYDPSLQDYSEKCEETQAFSGTYNRFARELAADLIERYDLRGKHILEIGCGKGEFLALLCEMGGSTGTGFDPVYDGRVKEGGGLTFVKNFYSDKYSSCEADFVVCKMTLEHIGPTGAFISTLRKALGDRQTTVFFQVPDVTRILRELAFWDVYYEHCSYFTPGSLARLFKMHGFEVLGIRHAYGSQYLLLEARPTDQIITATHTQEEAPEDIKNAVRYFSENVQQKQSLWRHKLREFNKTGYRTLLWGSGSKGVAFLTTLGITDEIRYVVDINPLRKGSFMAGTGHEIISPQLAADYQPDAVILMNPVYRDEVKKELTGMGVHAELLTV